MQTGREWPPPSCFVGMNNRDGQGKRTRMMDAREGKEEKKIQADYGGSSRDSHDSRKSSRIEMIHFFGWLLPRFVFSSISVIVTVWYPLLSHLPSSKRI